MVLFECATDLLKSKRMKEVVVIQKGDDGTSCDSNTVGNHRAPTLLP